MINGIVKSVFCIVAIFVLIIMAFETSDPIKERLYASLGLLVGCFAYKLISNKTTHSNEKS